MNIKQTGELKILTDQKLSENTNGKVIFFLEEQDGYPKLFIRPV